MTKQKYDPHHIDINKCADNIGNRFDMVLIAAARARELKKGYSKKVNYNNSSIIIALREIEAKLTGIEYSKKD